MTETDDDIDELRKLLTWLTRVLIVVAVLALIYTCVNVTIFAIGHGTSPWIAWLLDPMVSIVLTTILIIDGRLSKWAEHASGSSVSAALLRWFAGLATWSMNVWSALWPDGGFGMPRHMDVGAFWTHSIPPILLILMAEASTAYRRRVEKIIARLAEKQRLATARAAKAPATPRTATPPGAAATPPLPAPAATPGLPLPAPASRPAATPSQPTATPPTSSPATTPATQAASSSGTPGTTPDPWDLDKVAATFRGLEAALGKSPSDQALADALGVSRSRAQQLRTKAIEAGHADLAKPLRSA